MQHYNTVQNKPVSYFANLELSETVNLIGSEYVTEDKCGTTLKPTLILPNRDPNPITHTYPTIIFPNLNPNSNPNSIWSQLFSTPSRTFHKPNSKPTLLPLTPTPTLYKRIPTSTQLFPKPALI